MLHIMQAILLAGGQNTRVRHLYPDLPKVMFPLGDRPYLDHYIDTLFEEGVSELIILASYKSHAINNHLSARPEIKTGKIKIIEQPENLGPAGAMSHIENLLQDRFLLLYCDILFKTNLKKAYAKLDDSKFEICTFLTKDGFGMWDDMEAEIDETTQTVTHFEPNAYTKTNGWMDVGQVYRKSILKKIKIISPMEKGHVNKIIWPDLIAQGQLTYHKVGPVFDIGTEKNYETTKKIFARDGLKALDGEGLSMS